MKIKPSTAFLLILYFSFAAWMIYLTLVEPNHSRFGWSPMVQFWLSVAGSGVIFLLVIFWTLISQWLKPKHHYRLVVHTFSDLGPTYIKKLEDIAKTKRNQTDSGKQVLIFDIWSRDEDYVGQIRHQLMEDGQVKDVFYRVVSKYTTE